MTYDQPNGVVKVYQDGEERTDLRYDKVLPTAQKVFIRTNIRHFR